MLTDDFLRQQAAESRTKRQTTVFLRQFIFRIVDTSLREVFGDNYSIRCLQASIAIQMLLTDFGIRSHVMLGAACFSRATKGNPFQLSWAGFWGQDHHSWVAVEFVEVADLTISQLHLHPASSYNTDETIPAIWWNPADVWPPIMLYVPEGIVIPDLPTDEVAKLEKLKSTVEVVKRRLMETCGPTDVLFEPILYGPDHLQEMTMAGHAWLVKSLQIQQRGIPMPDWIIDHERQLMNELQDRT